MIHSITELSVCAFAFQLTASTRTFNTNTALNGTGNIVFIKVNGLRMSCDLFKGSDCCRILSRVLLNVSKEVFQAVLAEVVFLAFTEYRGQGFFDNVVIEEHPGKVGDFAFHQRFLKFDT